MTDSAPRVSAATHLAAARAYSDTLDNMQLMSPSFVPRALLGILHAQLANFPDEPTPAPAKTPAKKSLPKSTEVQS